MGNCLKSTRTNSDFFVITRNEGQQNQENDVQPRHPPPPYQVEDPILHPTPGVSRPVSQLTEEEQVKIAIRLGLICTLPIFKFEEEKREKLVECIICMCEYEVGEELRYLPCLHTYHKVCIDDWLTRSFVCPSCLDEVDIALMRSPKTTKLNSPENNRCNSGESQVNECEVGQHEETEAPQCEIEECNSQPKNDMASLPKNFTTETTHIETIEPTGESFNVDASDTKGNPGENTPSAMT